MTYQRFTRAQRHARYAKMKKERVYTALGLFVQVIRILGLWWVIKPMVRRPWHTADLYVDGSLVMPIYLFPNERMAEMLARVEREAMKKAVAKLRGPKPEHARRP